MLYQEYLSSMLARLIYLAQEGSELIIKSSGRKELKLMI